MTNKERLDQISGTTLPDEGEEEHPYTCLGYVDDYNGGLQCWIENTCGLFYDRANECWTAFEVMPDIPFIKLMYGCETEDEAIAYLLEIYDRKRQESYPWRKDHDLLLPGEVSPAHMEQLDEIVCNPLPSGLRCIGRCADRSMVSAPIIGENNICGYYWDALGGYWAVFRTPASGIPDDIWAIRRATEDEAVAVLLDGWANEKKKCEAQPQVEKPKTSAPAADPNRRRVCGCYHRNDTSIWGVWVVDEATGEELEHKRYDNREEAMARLDEILKEINSIRDDSRHPAE